MICKALINACWGAKRARIRPTRRDSHMHGGRADKCLSRACVAWRHCAIDPNAYTPLTYACGEARARGVESPRPGPFKSSRVHSTHKGEETGGKPVSREEVALRPARASYPRPPIAISQRFRSCTGTSVLSVCPGSYSVVAHASANIARCTQAHKQLLQHWSTWRCLPSNQYCLASL